MLYFFLAPRGWRKLFVVKHDLHPTRKETLAEYYLRSHLHVIPDEVEFWEFNEEQNELNRLEFNLFAQV